MSSINDTENRYPGLVGYGLQGSNGDPGHPGSSIMITPLEVEVDASVISTLISKNLSLSVNAQEYVLYKKGDIFIDDKGKVFKITDPKLGKFEDIGEIYTKSLFINTNMKNKLEFKRIYAHNSLIDTFYTNNLNVDTKDTRIYDTLLKDYGKTNIVNVEVNNNIIPFVCLAADNQVVGLVLKGENIFCFGNPGEICSFAADFKNVLFKGNALKRSSSEENDYDSLLTNTYVDTKAFKLFSNNGIKSCEFIRIFNEGRVKLEFYPMNFFVTTNYPWMKEYILNNITMSVNFYTNMFTENGDFNYYTPNKFFKNENEGWKYYPFSNVNVPAVYTNPVELTNIHMTTGKVELSISTTNSVINYETSIFFQFFDSVTGMSVKSAPVKIIMV